MLFQQIRKTLLGILIVFVIFSNSSCNQNSKPQSPGRIETEKKFQKIKELAKHRESELFDVFNLSLTDEETDALKFLYANMPLSDLADYSGDYYLQHVKITFKSRNEMDWGKTIPDDIFYHFVLPHRVNNENLDSARTVFFNELKSRVKGLSMYDAALEVNHWCHEKVEYRPADIRTSAPLATVKTAFGRCGEESTFAVAALRSVTIPARQVYSPRWAHSDDNHAWVEVWIDGVWKFLGACEPEPVLNLGWFNEAASRAMYIRSRVYGKFHGEESDTPLSEYDEVNVIETYAKTFKQFVKVVDLNGNPVPGAKVEYKLYNYAEFYPLTVKQSDKNGVSFIITGFGDLLIWASNTDSYGFRKVTIGEKDTVTITMSDPEFKDTHWELIPPAASDFVKVNITEEQKAANAKRLQYEDSVRNSYVSSFISEKEFLGKVNDKKLWKYVKGSRGNYDEIIGFIEKNRNAEWVDPMLGVIAAKDLRDTKAAILTDHLISAAKYADKYPTEIFTRYILNPRIANEMMVAYRKFLSEKMTPVFNNDVNNLIDWIKDNIVINDEAQFYSLPITPVGVYKLRVADRKSRDIFFVATCRTFGIPARLEPGTFKPQYLSGNSWVDVYFDGKPKEVKKFDVSFQPQKKDLKFTPQYYHHFTLARFGDNRFETLDFGEYVDIDKIEDFQLRAGLYRLITSNRLSSGRILVDMKYFNIRQDTIIGLEFPEHKTKTEILGYLDRANLSRLIYKNDKRAKVMQERAQTLQESSNIVVVIFDTNKEPSKHTLTDIQKIKKDFDKLNNTIVFVAQKKNLTATFKVGDYPNLPFRTVFVTSEEDPRDLLKISLNKKGKGSLPEIFIVNPKGGVIFYTEGYQVGIGSKILELL